MDYCYLDEEKQIMIETLQRETRNQVIEQYILCRKQKHITQTELAKRSGLTRTNISRFESGRYNPSLEMLVRIADALEMKLEFQLIDEEKTTVQ